MDQLHELTPSHCSADALVTKLMNSFSFPSPLLPPPPPLPLLQELRAQMAHRNSLPSSSSSTSASSSSSSASSIHLSASQQADGARNAQYQFSKGLLVAVNGGSRVLSYCEPLSCLLASQPSPQPTLVPGETPTTTTRSSSVDRNFATPKKQMSSRHT